MDRRIYEKKREERKRRKKNKFPADTDHPYIISCALEWLRIRGLP